MRIGDTVYKEKVLIIMPTYHSKMEWIERAVNSVISQTYDNIECMVVKDGCREADAGKACVECENCRATCSFFKSLSDKRFSFFTLPVNHGAAGWGPRNFAIMNSHHDLICYLDDDNWYEPDHVEKLYEAISDRDSDMAYTGTRLWTADMKVMAERMHPAAPEKGHIDTSEIMHRRRLIHTHGGWRKVPKCNDWDIVSRWEGVRWSHTNSITLNFYVREGCGIHRL